MPSCRWGTPPGSERSGCRLKVRSFNPGESEGHHKYVLSKKAHNISHGKVSSRRYRGSSLKCKVIGGKSLGAFKDAPDSAALQEQRRTLSEQFASDPSPTVDKDDYLWSVSRSFAFVGLLCTALLVSIDEAVKVTLKVFSYSSLNPFIMETTYFSFGKAKHCLLRSFIHCRFLRESCDK